MTESSQSRAKHEMVLIVEDDDNSAELLRTFVEAQGYGATVANSLAEARQQLILHEPAVVLLDLHLPDGSGMDLFDDESLRGDCDIVLITGYASVETSIQALRLGAADYLIKPVSLKVLRNVFARLREGDEAGHEAESAEAGREPEGRAGRAIGRDSPTPGRGGLGDDGRSEEGGPEATAEVAARPGRGADRDNRSPTARAAPRRGVDLPLIKGRSDPIAEVLRQIDKVARTSVSVFIVGESGTGKELVAQSVHRTSRRRNGPFEAINCGAISAQLIESELFGHEKGSFTGAIRQHKGFFERASGGTLFLDEITEMSLDLQVKLLRVLETGTFSRV
ncbi:MAG: sigma 54-interacting transcriptional regulator, partial [Burkholderiaceae bacterium]